MVRDGHNSAKCVPGTYQHGYYGGPSASYQSFANGVNYYAFGGSGDVIYDYEVPQPPLWNQGLEQRISSKQITSVDSGIPLIGFIDYGLHAVVVGGGHWHPDGANYAWDTVYLNDPYYGKDSYAPGGWLERLNSGRNILQHLISSSAASQWTYNLMTYGTSVSTLDDDPNLDYDY